MSISAQISHAPLRLIGRMPLKAHYANARFLAWLIGDVIRYRRDVVSFNLARCFPEKTTRELKELRKEAYRHFADIVGESFWFGACRDPRRLHDARIVEIANPEVISALFDSSPSVAVLYSHCGNWEIMGGWFAYAPYGELGYKEDAITVVYKSLTSGIWDHIMKDNRLAPLLRTAFHGYVDSTKVLRHALEHKNEKRVYIFPTDQFPYKNATKHDIGDFLGQSTLAMTGGAALARKLGMAIEYMSFECVGRGKYRARFETICTDPSTLTPEEIMSRFYRLLEKDIKAQPWNYLWTHKRWKNLQYYQKKGK